MNIWVRCEGSKFIKPIDGIGYRLIENQEKAATLSLVDNLEEQQLLEELIETVKPQSIGEELHYLLATPFRYPPLKHGSRFGDNTKNGIFYAGLNIKSTLAEVAYYRYIFWHSMEGKKPKTEIRSEHSLFSFNYRTDQGVQLQNEPFVPFQKEITMTNAYSHTQQLGNAMRDDGVIAFEYPSARLKDGLCLGLFTKDAFTSNSPNRIDTWFCQTTASQVSFKAKDYGPIYAFDIQQFLVNEEFPLPA